MDDKKKKFIIPQALLVSFGNEDVIRTSGEGPYWGDEGDDNGEAWED